MAKNNPFPTYAMHLFLIEIDRVQNLHQRSFGCPNILGIVVQHFLNDPVGNLALYTSITTLVGSKVGTTETPASLAYKWFYLNSIHHITSASDDGDLMTLLGESSRFWDYLLTFEEYDQAKYYRNFIMNIRCLLCHMEEVDRDLLQRIVLVDPVCFFYLKLGPSRCQPIEDGLHSLSLIALSSSLENLKDGFSLHSRVIRDPNPFLAYVDLFRRKLEITQERTDVFLAALDSGLIRDSVLNQGEATSAGFANLIGSFTGVPSGESTTLVHKAYHNLERLYDLYADRQITDAPKKVVTPRCICGERHCHAVACTAVDIWNLLGVGEEGGGSMSASFAFAPNRSTPRRPSSPGFFFDCRGSAEEGDPTDTTRALTSNHSIPHSPSHDVCFDSVGSEPEESKIPFRTSHPPTKQSSSPDMCWFLAAVGIRLSTVLYICWCCVSAAAIASGGASA